MNKPDISQIEEILKTVYDPEFPIVDIYTLWLIYNINIDNKKKIIDILMTLTSPACPLWDMITESIKESINKEINNYEVKIEISFEPLWNPDLIKDDDLKRMFSN